MPDSAANSDLEPKKRRSTRIVQAVPLTVTGVDALGRPFQERTSTLFINCHGCRYQSKHYVLKNMWVALEVPHPETGREPRSVRARVTWIQRPRTVRELFQIGVELEIPGNVWGIAFPPEDWFPFPEVVPEIPAPAAEAQPQAESAPEEWVLPAAQTPAPREEAPAPREDNLRVLPVPGSTEAASIALARQVAKLVLEAKQQVQSAVREATATAVAAETRPILAALQNQLKEAAEKSVKAAAAAYAEEAIRQTLAKVEEARETGAASLREKWPAELQLHLDEANAKLSAHLAKISQAHEATLEQQLQNHVQLALQKLNMLGGDLEARFKGAETGVQRFRQEIDAASDAASLRWKEMVENRAEEARGRLEELAKAARHLSDEIAAATSAAQNGWRGRLDADLAAATTRWNEKVESSLESAARQAAERLARNSQAATAKVEQELTMRAAALRQSVEQATTEAGSTLDTLRTALNKESARARASLAEIQQAAGRMEDFSRRLEAMGQATAEKLQQRFEEILATESAELNRRAESAVSAMAERLQPVLESAGHQTLAQLGAQLEQQLAPHVDRVNDLLRKLTTGEGLAEESLRTHQQRLQEASERTVQDSAARLQESVRRFEHDFQEAGRAATARWLAELDTKATDTTHTTFEALYKSADWYEKKVQTHMQATLDKGLEQASDGLREKAGEISGLFASELDHYSRSYVEHAQSQMDEVVKDAVQRGRVQIAQAAETTAAAFGEEARRTAQGERERFTASLSGALEQTAARLQTHMAQVRARIDADARQFFVDFHKGMTQEIQQGVAAARKEIEAATAPAKESLRAEREAQERQLQETATRLSNESIEGYKRRLENVSNSWLVTTVTKLGQQSQDMIGTLANTAEERLRQTCANVFAHVGETLRQRLLDFSKNLAGTTPPPEKK
ncbi:MAG: hypothetical protein HY237_01455 [Acidobacteria bacterium]|nr:hypothetical protein [Acidobacteriota bacterium]